MDTNFESQAFLTIVILILKLPFYMKTLTFGLI